MTLLLVAAILMSDAAIATKTPRDFALTADPHSKPWKKAVPVVTESGPTGVHAGGHRTEIRALWTAKNLYLLYTCPYEKLYLKPEPTTTAETNKLWNWDVAEVFIGSDMVNIHRYKEFQVSPQGEWVDLDIDTQTPLPEGGWKWNSGFEVKARLDEKAKIWYGEMKIPFASIDTRPPKKGNELRINFYRLQGPPADRVYVSWKQTGKMSYHVPEAFGTLRLE